MAPGGDITDHVFTRSLTFFILPRRIFPKMKSALVLHPSTKFPRKLSKHSGSEPNSVVENPLGLHWFTILKRTSRNLKYLHHFTGSSTYCSHITEKFVLVLQIRSKNLPGSNGNKGRTGVRSSEGLIRKRQLVRIKRGRNRCGVLLCACTLHILGIE